MTPNSRLISASGAIFSSLVMVSVYYSPVLSPILLPTLNLENTYSTRMLKSLPITANKSEPLISLYLVLVLVLRDGGAAQPCEGERRPTLRGWVNCRRITVTCWVHNRGDVWCDYINTHIYIFIYSQGLCSFKTAFHKSFFPCQFCGTQKSTSHQQSKKIRCFLLTCLFF